VIVECLRTELSSEENVRLGASFPPRQGRLLQVGNRYPVLGLQYDVGSIIWGTGAWVQVPVAVDRLLFAPLYLFEVFDARPSRHWQLKHWPDGAITLWPTLFYQEYFHGDLEVGKEQALETFSAVLAELIEEIEELDELDRRDSGESRRRTFEWPTPEAAP
jgi:hypothetical protein